MLNGSNAQQQFPLENVIHDPQGSRIYTYRREPVSCSTYAVTCCFKAPITRRILVPFSYGGRWKRRRKRWGWGRGRVREVNVRLQKRASAKTSARTYVCTYVRIVRTCSTRSISMMTSFGVKRQREDSLRSSVRCWKRSLCNFLIALPDW